METDETLLLPVEKKSSNFVSFLRVIIQCTNKWEKFLFFIGTLAAICTGLTQPFMSYAFGEVSQVFVKITSAVNNHTLNPSELENAYKTFDRDINKVIFHFFSCGVAFFTFGFIQFSLFKYVGDQTTYRIRENYISRLLRKDARYFDTVPSGHFSTVLNDNLERFREAFNEKLAFIICFSTDFLIGTSLAFYTDWKLSLYGSVFALGIAFSGLINSASMMKSTGKQNEHYANAGGIAFQTLGSFKTVISLNGQQQQLDRYSTELKSGEKHGFRRAFFLATSRSSTHFFCNALNGVILYAGADLIYNKAMDQVTIVTLFHYMLFSAFSLGEAFPHISYFSNAITSITPIAQVLTLNDDEIENNYVIGERNIYSGSITFGNVHFSYPSRPNTEVLKGISFEVSNGECIALVGASGSGKSTIVQLLLRYYDISFGNILIDGKKINDINLNTLRSVIGVVSQEPVLFNTTIEENIRFGNPNATVAEIYEALRQANAYNFVCSFPKGIKTIVGERGALLSGGQKQRIAIARILVRNPKILLLDEATSALDNQSEHIVQTALEQASQGRTTLVIAHRLSTIKHCRKILVMSHGEIVEAGNHFELLTHGGVYRNLVDAQLLESSSSEVKNQMKDDEKKEQTSRDYIEHGECENEEEMSGNEDEMKRILEEMSEEGASKANLWEIIMNCRPDWFILFFAVFGSAIQGFSFPILAQLIVRVYQAYAMEGDDILVYGHFWSLMFLALGVFRPITLYCQYFFFGKVAERLSTRLRIKSFKHLLSLPCAFYDDPVHSATRLANRLSADASNIKAAVDARLGSVLMTIVSCLVATSTASVYSWKVTVQVLLFFPILYLAKFCYEKSAVSAVREDSIAFGRSNKMAIEALQNVKTVRSLNMEKKSMNMITESLRELRITYPRRAFIQGLASGFSVGCSQIVYAISFKFGAYLVMNREVIPMNMYLALITLSYTSNMAGSAIAYLPDYKKALHAAGLIFKLFTFPATMPFDVKTGSENITKGEITGENVKFNYEQRPEHIVLNNVNLNVKPGKTLALVGPSGCGKSTIIALLERFYHVQQGRLTVDQENIEDIRLRHLRENFALVSQEPVLFNCSIKSNLLFGITRSVLNSEIEDALRTANAYQFVSQFPQGLDTLVGDRGNQLSGGQKQRIAIARAILRNPKVLLLDEATSALDADSEQIVQKALDNVSEKFTTIIVAHRLSTVVNADSIALLGGGSIIEQGTHDELMNIKGRYYDLVQAQRIETDVCV